MEGVDQAAAGFAGLALVGLIIAIIGGIIVFVCHIMVSVAAFKKEDTPLMGILSLVCGLSLILGWVKVGAWDVKKLMTWYTLAIVIELIGIVIIFAGGAGVAANAPDMEGLNITIPEPPQ